MLPPIRLVSRGRNRSFDYELAFRYWVEFGTREKAAKAMAHDGIINENGKPIHPTTVRRSAYIWSLEHPKETLEYYHSLNRGYYPDGMDGDDWKRDVCIRALALFQGRASLDRILMMNNAKEYFDHRYKK